MKASEIEAIISIILKCATLNLSAFTSASLPIVTYSNREAIWISSTVQFVSLLPTFFYLFQFRKFINSCSQYYYFFFFCWCRKPKCRLLVTHNDYSMMSKLPKDETSVVTILRNPIDRVFSAYEFSVEVAARFLVHPNLTSATRMSGRLRSKNTISTLDIWPWKYLVPWMREDLFARVCLFNSICRFIILSSKFYYLSNNLHIHLKMYSAKLINLKV